VERQGFRLRRHHAREVGRRSSVGDLGHPRGRASTPDEYRKELAAFGWWFAAECFDDGWSIAQLNAALELAREIDADHLVAERLVGISTRFPTEAMTCMRIMVEGDKEGWGIIGWRDDARAAIANALASDDAKAHAAAEGLVNYLGTRGHLDFRDLLGHQNLTPHDCHHSSAIQFGASSPPPHCP